MPLGETAYEGGNYALNYITSTAQRYLRVSCFYLSNNHLTAHYFNKYRGFIITLLWLLWWLCNSCWLHWALAEVSVVLCDHLWPFCAFCSILWSFTDNFMPLCKYFKPTESVFTYANVKPFITFASDFFVTCWESQLWATYAWVYTPIHTFS